MTYQLLIKRHALAAQGHGSEEKKEGMRKFYTDELV